MPPTPTTPTFLFQDQVKSSQVKFGDHVVISIRIDPSKQHQQPSTSTTTTSLSILDLDSSPSTTNENPKIINTKQVNYTPSYKEESLHVEVEGMLLRKPNSSTLWIQCDIDQQKSSGILFKTPTCARYQSNYEYLDQIGSSLEFTTSSIPYSKHGFDSVSSNFRVFDLSRGGVSVKLLKKRYASNNSNNTDNNITMTNSGNTSSTTTPTTMSFTTFLWTYKRTFLILWIITSFSIFFVVNGRISFGGTQIVIAEDGIRIRYDTDDDQQQEQQQSTSSSSSSKSLWWKQIKPTPAISSFSSSSCSTTVDQHHRKVYDKTKPQQEQEEEANSNKNLGFPHPPYPIPRNILEPLHLPPPGACTTMTRHVEHASNCPDEELYLSLWNLLRDYTKSRYAKRPLVMVDVGSNKGYTAAAMLESLNLTTMKEYYFTQEDLDDESYDIQSNRERLNISTTSKIFRHYSPYFSRQALAFDIYEYAEQRNTPTPGWRHALFGACCDGEQARPYESHSRIANHPWLKCRKADVYIPEVEIYMFDGTRTHINYVKQFYEGQLAKYNRQYELAAAAAPNEETRKKILSQKTNIRMHFTRAAVSNRTGETRFCEDALGLEFGNVCEKAGHGTPTPIISLDSWIGMRHVDVIDILVTDAEGNDFPVAVNNEGVRKRWLEKGKIGLYIFEIQKGVVDKTPLDTVVEDLESWGYTCYFPVHGNGLKRHVVKVTPVRGLASCWEDWYTEQTRGWANMMCAHEKNFPELRLVMEQLSELPKDHSFNWCDISRVNQVFFEHYPGRNWTWAREQMRILEKIEADKKTTRPGQTATATTAPVPETTPLNAWRKL